LAYFLIVMGSAVLLIVSGLVIGSGMGQPPFVLSSK
jgi:hypothetical protein